MAALGMGFEGFDAFATVCKFLEGMDPFKRFQPMPLGPLLSRNMFIIPVDHCKEHGGKGFADFV